MHQELLLTPVQYSRIQNHAAAGVGEGLGLGLGLSGKLSLLL
jgi:hypothetical protein